MIFLLFKYFKSFDVIITDVLKIYCYIIVDTSDLHPAMKMKFHDLKKATLEEVPNIVMIGTLCLESISLREQLNLGPTIPKTQQTTPNSNPQTAEITPAIRNLHPYESLNFICQSIIWMKLSKRYSKHH